MDVTATLHPTPRAWLLNSALAPHLDAFAAHFQRGRYAASTIQGYVNGIAHFAHWMTQCELSVQMLDQRSVEHFLNEHLPNCDCPAVRRDHRTLHAAWEPAARIA